MKIAYILSFNNGIESFIYRELEALEKKNIKFEIFTIKLKKGLYNPKSSWSINKTNPISAIQENIKFVIFNPLKCITLLIEALKTQSITDLIIAAQHAPKIKKDFTNIHCHFGDHKFFVGYYLKKLTGKKLSVTIHAYELYQNPNKKMFNNALNYADKIITISDNNKKILTEKYAVSQKKISVVRLFVDTEKFKPEHSIKILIVARFVEKKGHKILFNAIKRLNNKQIKLWVVGDGPLNLTNLALKLGIQEQVCFFGPQKDSALRALFNECDIFCLPSITSKEGDKEGIPVAIMEAMAFGKPTISTNHSGIPEILTKDQLVEEGNVTELEMKIREKIHSRENKNRKIILENYSEKNLDMFLEVIDDSK